MTAVPGFSARMRLRSPGGLSACATVGSLEVYSTSWVRFTVAPPTRCPVAVSWVTPFTGICVCSAASVSDARAPSTTSVASSPVAVDVTPSTGSCAEIVVVPRPTESISAAVGRIVRGDGHGLVGRHPFDLLREVDLAAVRVAARRGEGERPSEAARRGRRETVSRCNGPTTVSVEPPPESALEMPVFGSVALITGGAAGDRVRDAPVPETVARGHDRDRRIARREVEGGRLDLGDAADVVRDGAEADRYADACTGRRVDHRDALQGPADPDLEAVAEPRPS